jgi:hypothetical protein
MLLARQAKPSEARTSAIAAIVPSGFEYLFTSREYDSQLNQPEREEEVTFLFYVYFNFRRNGYMCRQIGSSFKRSYCIDCLWLS